MAPTQKEQIERLAKENADLKDKVNSLTETVNQLKTTVELLNRPVSMGTLKPLSGVIKLTLPIETPVIHVQGGFKVPMETGRNLEHTTERHQRGFKVPMETGSESWGDCCQG